MSSEAVTLSLQQKVSDTLFGVIGMLALVSYLVLDAIVAPTFDELEMVAAETNLVRAERAIGAEQASLKRLAADWAPWDDTYAFVQGHYPNFEQSNLPTSTLNSLDLNLMLFYNIGGDLVWERLLIDEQPYELAATGVFGTYSTTERMLQDHVDESVSISGILDTGVGPMLLASQPIIRSDGSGPIVGTIILGRLLDDEHLVKLRQITEVAFSWHALDKFEDGHEEKMSQLLSEPIGSAQNSIGDDWIDTYKFLSDLQGNAVLVLHAQTARSISALASTTLNSALFILAIAALVIALVIWLLLNNMIVRPLAAVQSHISDIRLSGDLRKRLGMTRGDEIGVVARNFDELTGQLDDARKLLLDQSFKAGKADNAAEVLHNIRNAMTPVINGIDRLGMVCSVSKGLKVRRASEQLKDPACEADRREKLIRYIESAFSHIEEAHSEGDRELKAVSRQARQVEAILADQEKHAKAGPAVETLALSEMVDEAVLVLPRRKVPKIDLSIGVDMGRFRIRGHRVGLLQVLGNLVLNAYEAIQRSSADSGRIELSADCENISGKDMVRLTVRDTGCGFDDEQRARIFQRGFSSKNGNLSGLGLHWCANALAGMGGRISAESSGDGRGAAFHVLLPVASGG